MIRGIEEMPTGLVVGLIDGLPDLVEQLALGPWGLAGSVPVREERVGVLEWKAKTVGESHGCGVGLVMTT